MAASNHTILLVGALATVAIAAYYLQDETQKPKPPKSGVRRVKKAPADAAVQPEDFTARFEPVGDKLNNRFEPLVKKDIRQAPLQAAAPQEILRIPTRFAGGEADWRYHGVAVLNGERLALLENEAKKQSGYVALGEQWKDCTIAEIEPDSLTVMGQDGATATIKRFTGDEPKKPAEGVPGAPPPEAPALAGPLPDATKMEVPVTKMGVRKR